MPLSDHEQRILAEIERRLLEEDPHFAEQVAAATSMTLASRLERRMRLALVAFFPGLILLLAGVVLSSRGSIGLALAAVGFLVMVVSVFEFLQVVRRRAMLDDGPDHPAPRRPRPPAARRQRRAGGWWARTTERWREHWENQGPARRP